MTDVTVDDRLVADLDAYRAAVREFLAGPALDCERSVLGAQSWLLVIAER